VVEVNPFPLEVLLQVVEVQRGVAGRYADITLALALTGLRLGKLPGLRVRDVVSVRYPGLGVKRSVPESGRTGAVIERSTTKSGRSRVVPLSDRVRPVVEEWATGREPYELLFPAPEVATFTRRTGVGP
jgi:integrase